MLPSTVAFFAPFHRIFIYKTTCRPTSGIPLYSYMAGVPPRLVVYKRPNGGCSVRSSGHIFLQKLPTETFLPLWAPPQHQMDPRNALGSVPNRPSGTPNRSTGPGQVWGHTWIGLGPHLGRFGTAFGSVLDRTSVHGTRYRIRGTRTGARGTTSWPAGAGLGPHWGPWDPHLGPAAPHLGPAAPHVGPPAPHVGPPDP